MRKRFLLATALAAVAATAGAGIVFAAGAVLQSHEWEGGGSGAGCGTRFFTTEDEFDVEQQLDGDFDALTPAATAHLAKRCQGAAVATFSTEVSADIAEAGIQSHDDLDVVLRATCNHPAFGVANPCTAGERVYGEPGGEDDPVKLHEGVDSDDLTLSFQWVFPSLRPGAWTIDVLAGEGEDLVLGDRTLFVETL